MKKKIALFLCLCLVMFMAAGCGSKTEAVKTGFAVITSIAKSTNATADAEGLAEADSTIVALTIDSAGKIVTCRIDVAQTKANFTATGTVSTDLATEYKTKQELGANYGMKGSSGIGKEWNEQADAFAAYVIGKTVAEVKGIALSAEGVPTASDLTSSVTIHVGDFISAIEKAAANAKDLGAKSGDKLGMGVTTSIGNSKAATADAEGQVQVYTTYTVTTTDANGKITSCFIDASQTNVKFNATGTITTDLNGALKSKQELGNDYGMKGSSGIGKEWFEQANAFAVYATGKTLEQVKGVAVNAEGVPTASDLTSSVTIHVSDFIKVIEKSVNNAK